MAEKKPKKRSAAAAAQAVTQPEPEVTALLEGLMSRMEVVLMEMESLRDHSTHHSAELTRLLTELSAENRALKEQFQALAHEMQDTMDIMEELIDTKYAQDAKEKQARKLSRHF